MERKDGDYSNLMSYFSNLLGIKKLREYDIHGYKISFLNYTYIKDADNMETEVLRCFPEKNSLDRIKSIQFSVINDKDTFTLEIEWNHILIDGEYKEGTLENIEQVLESATFRFF
ncbi:hypothetical protein [Caldiplasma sukawensis]